MGRYDYPPLQARRQRHREFKNFAQGHIAREVLGFEPRPVLCDMVATRHMWLLKLKLIKIK